MSKGIRDMAVLMRSAACLRVSSICYVDEIWGISLFLVNSQGIIYCLPVISMAETGFEMASPDSEQFVELLLARLRDERLSLGLSQEALAATSGVDLAAISRAERQLRIPSLALIRDLAIGLKLDFPDLCREIEKLMK